MMKVVAHSFKTNGSTQVFNTMNANFWHALLQEVVGTGRIQDLGKFVDSESIKWTNRAVKEIIILN